VFLVGLGFGLWVLVSRLFVGFCGFSLLFFVFFLLAHVWFLLITFNMLRGALHFFIFFNIYISLLTYKKKESDSLSFSSSRVGEKRLIFVYKKPYGRPPFGGVRGGHGSGWGGFSAFLRPKPGLQVEKFKLVTHNIILVSVR
jgi:hypothetical protein